MNVTFLQYFNYPDKSENSHFVNLWSEHCIYAVYLDGIKSALPFYNQLLLLRVSYYSFLLFILCV